MYIKTTTDYPAGALRVKIIGVEVTGPYVDCDNKNESLETLLKRSIVLYPDGSLVLQVHYI